ncbi:hypothetical protein HGRIS_005137 [Hohenbuehelia grisea]|uniref:Uncharacterized protein n=1 Tax=Hohenbuehelia grisea TaxID=104357 RepID=A0ABR3JF28_9AGAR
MLDLNHAHRRVARHVARDLKVLHPRFSPTAIFDDPLLPTLSVDINPPPILSDPIIVPPPVTTPTPVLPKPNPGLPPPPAQNPPPVSSQPSTLDPLPPSPTSNPALNPLPTPETPTSTTPLTTTTPASSFKLPTLSQDGTSFVTVSRTVAAAITGSSSSAAPTVTGEPSSRLSTGAVVGGIGAGIVGVAAVIFAIFFFLRRWRKQGAEENAFNADSFRRSAVLVDDSPRLDSYGGGSNPRPPTMIERQLNAHPTTYGAQYDYGNQTGYGATDYSQFASVAPGQVISPLPTANSADPMYASSPYAMPSYAPTSPTSPYVAPYDSAYNDHGELVSAVPLNRQQSLGSTGAQFTRKPSVKLPTSPTSSDMPMDHYPIPVNDYVDLNRSSVSPFQAAQYAEISKKLNTDVLVGAPALAPAHDQDTMHFVVDEVPPSPPAKPAASPFADPAASPAQELEVPMTAHLDDATARSRIDSMPPMLPEIRVQPRVSGYEDFPSSPLTGGFPVSPGPNQKFPSTPSPLASSFIIQAPPAAMAPPPPAYGAEEPKVPAAVPRVQHTAAGAKRPDTVYSTMYNAEDAYGGF